MIVHLRRAAAAALLFVWWTVPANAWTVEAFQDPVTLERVSAAVAESDDGSSIAIFRSEDSRVRWVLRLPVGTFSQLPSTGRIAAFRVDRADVSNVEIDPSSILSIEQPFARDTWVRSVLWHGQDPSPTRGNLRNILDGETLTMRFYLQGEQPADAVFSLDGAPSVISEALGIAAQTDPEAMRATSAREDVLLTATQICTASPDLQGCIRVLLNCTGGSAQSIVPDEMRSCMAASGYRVP